MTSARCTDVEDLTDQDVSELLDRLLPSLSQHVPQRVKVWQKTRRDLLRELVGLLDRTGADWPHFVLGLEPTP